MSDDQAPDIADLDPCAMRGAAAAGMNLNRIASCPVVTYMAEEAEVGMNYAVSDRFYDYQQRFFVIGPSVVPARILNAIDVTRAGHPAQKLDIEGIANDDDSFSVASEGRTGLVIPLAPYKVGADGMVKEEIGLPAKLMAVERRFGFERVTKIGNTLRLAVQREWTDDSKNHVKLVSHTTATKA